MLSATKTIFLFYNTRKNDITFDEKQIYLYVVMTLDFHSCTRYPYKIIPFE